MSSIAVYCSSSNAIDASFIPIAETVGRGLARRGHTLIYGGGDVGLMGAAARSATGEGGTVVGVIPEKLESREGLYTLADELIITDTMSERKQTIYERSDAFVVLPGGYGTLEEFMEVLTLRHLGYHDQPIILVNANGFFDTLIAFFDELFEQHFARVDIRDSAYIATSADDTLAFLDTLD